MKIEFDEEADALYLGLGEGEIAETIEVHPGIILDINDQKEVLGIEILGVKKRIPLAELKQFIFKVA